MDLDLQKCGDSRVNSLVTRNIGALGRPVAAHVTAEEGTPVLRLLVHAQGGLVLVLVFALVALVHHACTFDKQGSQH